MYIRFCKTKPHCTLFILLQALYNSHSKKILPYIVIRGLDKQGEGRIVWRGFK